MTKELTSMNYPLFTDNFQMELPSDQALVLCMNHMNYIPSHTIKKLSPIDAEEPELTEHLRLPWRFTVEKVNITFHKISENQTEVKVSVTTYFPMRSYDFKAIKKVLSHLKKTKYFYHEEQPGGR